MSALRTKFRQTNTLQVNVALNVVMAEISSIEAALLDPKNAVIKLSLIARKKQLQQMLATLEAQKVQGNATVLKSDNKDFATVAALVYVFLAREAAERANEARQQNQMSKKAHLQAPKLAA